MDKNEINQLFFESEFSTTHQLSCEEAKHCIKVLRHKIDDTIYITDGRGILYKGVITSFDKNFVNIAVTNQFSEANTWKLKRFIALAPTKNIDRIEWFVEKAVEIGIDGIHFVYTEHSERKKIRRDRIEKILISAMKQSFKLYSPILYEHNSIKNFIQHIEKQDVLSLPIYKFIACCEDIKDLPKRQTIDNYIDKNKINASAYILIGPEGDFSQNEINLAYKAKFMPITLGEHRLRTETAALTSLSWLSILEELFSKA